MINDKNLKGVIESGILGALIIGGVKYISLYADPLFAPVLAAAPIGLIATYFLDSRKIVKTYVNNYVGVTILLLISAIIFFIVMNYTNIHRHVATTIAVASWATLNLLKIAYNKKYIKL